MTKSTKIKAFTLVELVLAIGLFGVIIVAVAGTLSYGQESTQAAGNTSRATFVADEGIEAVQNIADADFANLVDGNHGLLISGGQWTFSGANDVTDIFTRQITISSIDSTTKTITSTVTWQQQPTNDTHTITVSTRLTDWDRVVVVSNDATRSTQYYIPAATITGTTYSLNLDQDLAADYFVIIQGSDSNGSTTDTGPDSNYLSLTADPFGTGELSASGGANVLGFTRGGDDFDWSGVITVVECIDSCDTAGFNLLDVDRVAHSGTGTSGSDTSNSWNDINQVMLMGGFNGSGCDTTNSAEASTHVCHVRFFPSGTGTINWTRSSGAGTLSTATSTVMTLEWGTEWFVQRRTISGTAGGDGANSTGEYSTSAISTVTRNDTWVWGTGWTGSAGVGLTAESVLITLGNGVNINATETVVSIGQEAAPASRSFEVYAITHNQLATSYAFKADGNSGDLTVDSTVTAATDSGNRMALVYNGLNGSTDNYPMPMFSARYFTNTSIRSERRRSGEAWPAWIQGVDFSGIQDDNGAGNWALPQQQGSVNLSGNTDAIDVQVQGNYAYVLRATTTGGFAVVDISNLSAPASVASATLASTPQKFWVSGSYAYVVTSSNTQEFQVVDITNPLSPSVIDNVNLSGNEDATAVFATANKAYVGRTTTFGNPEFLIYDVSTPASPVAQGTVELNSNVESIVVVGTYAYVTTSDNSEELVIIDVSNPLSPTHVGAYDATGTNDGYALDVEGNIAVMTTGTTLFVVDVTTPAATALLGSYSVGSTVNNLSYDSVSSYVFAGVVSGTQELRIIDISNPGSISLVGSYNAASTIMGIKYSQSLDRVFAASTDNTTEFIIYRPE